MLQYKQGITCTTNYYYFYYLSYSAAIPAILWKNEDRETACSTMCASSTFYKSMKGIHKSRDVESYGFTYEVALKRRFWGLKKCWRWKLTCILLAILNVAGRQYWGITFGKAFSMCIMLLMLTAMESKEVGDNCQGGVVICQRNINQDQRFSEGPCTDTKGRLTRHRQEDMQLSDGKNTSWTVPSKPKQTTNVDKYV